MRIGLWFLTITLALAAAYAQPQHPRRQGAPPPMDESTRAAFESCSRENNIPRPGSGTRPTREQHDRLRACLQSKGIEMPEHGPGARGGQRPPPPPAESEDNE